MEQTIATNVFKIGYSAEPLIFHLSAYKSVSLHKCPANHQIVCPDSTNLLMSFSKHWYPLAASKLLPSARTQVKRNRQCRMSTLFCLHMSDECNVIVIILYELNL